MRAPWLVGLALVGGACQHGGAARPAVCPTAPVVVTAQEQLAALAGCPRLPGLTVRGAAPFDLAPLAELTAVDGDLIIGPTFALSTIGLPALTTVGGRVVIAANGAATGLFAPRLVTAGALEVRDDLSVVTVSLPQLGAVAGDLTFARLPALEWVDLSSLATVGGARTVEVPAAATWLAPVAAGP